jgi:hypothetical protein
MDIKALKEECEVEMFFSYKEVLELIEIIEKQQKELDELKEKEKWFMNAINVMYKEI